MDTGLRPLMATTAIVLSGLVMSATASAQARSNRPSYSPKVVELSCDESGVQLGDALARLNPTADVYEVRISGVCAQPISLKNFVSITLTSANHTVPAVIGRVDLGTGNGYVRFESLTIRGTSTDTYMLLAYIVGLLEMNDVVLDCAAEESGCGAIVLYGGHARIYDTTVAGNWPSGRASLSALRGAAVFIATTPTGTGCPPFDYGVTRNSVLQLLSDNCQDGSVSASQGSFVSYQGFNSMLTSIYVRNGSVERQVSGSEQWFGQLRCSGAHDLVTDHNRVNYCDAQ